MEDQYDFFVQKHLARNVPLDFNARCERVRASLNDGQRASRRNEPARRYPGMLEAMTDGEFETEEAEEIVADISEVHVRYLAIQKTLDLSVPVKPVHRELSGLRRALEKCITRLEDEDRDAGVRFFNELDPDEELPNGEGAFETAGSISERVAIAGNRVRAWADELDRMLEYFDYKQGLVTRGNISLFATKFAVLALADLFEARNTMGRKASVSETMDYGRRGAHNDSPNARRYTGKFLDFVTAFFQTVDPQQFTRAVDEGFQDRVRKIAKARKKEPEVHKKLFGDVSVEDVLDFMCRAERL
jgi:hypothetical protein